MNKHVGLFRGTVGNPAPCWCSISLVGTTNAELRFTHEDLADLEYLVSQMKKAARAKLPENYKDEV